MPKLARKTKLYSATYTHAHLFQLAMGIDWFHDAFSNDHTPEVLDEMRQAWQRADVRQAVYELLEDRRRRGNGTREIPWAAEQFGDDGNDFFDDGEDADDPGAVVSNEPAAPVYLSCTPKPEGYAV